MTVTRMRTWKRDLNRILGPQFTLTRHFVENWRKRVGNEVHINAVKAIIKGAVLVQQGRKLMNGQGEEVNTLSLYWHPQMQIIISVDRYQNTAVSLLTDNNAPWPRGRLKRLIHDTCDRPGHYNGTESLWRRYGMRTSGGNI